ncbi:MAG: pyruvate kinase [Rhodospirillales bacterium]|nr:MAG: pyruvate kinase [Rhodospirillales bacterium]
MRRDRQTKIVATLGPATSDAATIGRLVEAGADVFRLNYSHGSHDDHAARFNLIRDLERRIGRPIGIIADLQGPKLRLGRFADGSVTLHPGQRFRLDRDPLPGTADRAPLPHPELFAAVRAGQRLLLDDGRIRLRVTATEPDCIETRVEQGGGISDHKGVNVPDAVLDLAALTPKDVEDLRHALGLGVPWVALSFVQRPEDVIAAKEEIGGRAGLIAKLEKPSAIEHFQAILAETDGVMVARGDLGVEMPPEDVPVLQKRIVRACRRAGKPVVVATQMLDSMVQAPIPTRAEASDVATAVNEGADALMLSAETAVGRFPVEAVAMMDRIMRRVEHGDMHREILDAVSHQPRPTAGDALSRAARQVAETISAVAIVTCTASGSTTLRVSRERPPVPILALTPIASTAHRLTLSWGVDALEVVTHQEFERMIAASVRCAASEGLARVGDPLVVIAGLPLMTPGTTTTLRIVTVGDDDIADPAP